MMPTGYTAKLLEKDLSFPEFATLCSRAFGALVELREDALDTKIPDKLPLSTYYRDELSRAEKELKEFKEASVEVLRSRFLAEKKVYLKDSISSKTKKEAENKKFEKMLEKVQKWEVPSTDHSNLKKFMIEQLEISISKLDFYEKMISSYKSVTFSGWKKSKLEYLHREIKYCSEQWEDEQKRNKERNEWIRLLKESLNSYKE
jgi:hypothetical protein